MSRLKYHVFTYGCFCDYLPHSIRCKERAATEFHNALRSLGFSRCMKNYGWKWINKALGIIIIEHHAWGR